MEESRRLRSERDSPIMLVSSAYARKEREGTERMRLKRGSMERLKRRGKKGSP